MQMDAPGGLRTSLVPLCVAHTPLVPRPRLFTGAGAPRTLVVKTPSCETEQRD